MVAVWEHCCPTYLSASSSTIMELPDRVPSSISRLMGRSKVGVFRHGLRGGCTRGDSTVIRSTYALRGALLSSSVSDSAIREASQEAGLRRKHARDFGNDGGFLWRAVGVSSTISMYAAFGANARRKTVRLKNFRDDVLVEVAVVVSTLDVMKFIDLVVDSALYLLP